MGITGSILSTFCIYYDLDDQLYEEILLVRVGSSWYEDTRKLYTYTTAGALDSTVEQTWEWNPDGWQNSNLHRFVYNSDGNQTQWRVSDWLTDHWRENFIELSDYNAAGQLTQATQEQLFGSHWYYIKRTNLDYGEGGYLQTETVQDWDYDTELWFDKTRQQLSYDEMGNQIELVTQNWDASDSLWINEYRYQTQYPSAIWTQELRPDQFLLRQNYPNPFNPTTTISYDLPYETHVELTVYDLTGREVVQLVNKTQSGGTHSINWNATDTRGLPVANGTYLYRIHNRGFVQTGKMLLLKSRNILLYPQGNLSYFGEVKQMKL